MINGIITDPSKPMVRSIVGGAAAQFITTELYAASKQTVRGFADYLINSGQPVPLGAINDNNAPLSYGDTRIYGLFHTIPFTGTSYVNLVLNDDGVHGNEGWSSITINGVTYQRGVSSTLFSTATIGLSGGGTTSTLLFSFQDSPLATSGFDEPDNTELQITWSI